MWDKRQRVLAVTVFTAFYCRVAVGATIQLDMALDAVDDLYLGCRDQMLEKVTSGLLSEELGRSPELKEAWSAKNCSAMIHGGVAEHTAALLAYAYGSKGFRKIFNNEVESLGTNASVYSSNFHFKSLHFLLMDALRLSKKETCQTVYRVSKDKYIVRNGSEVRFGRFTEVQTDYKELMEEPDLEDGFFFNITSCSVLNMEDNTCEGDIELLLAPSEVFMVEEVKDVPGDYPHTAIILKAVKRDPTDRCYLFPNGSPPGSSTQWLCSIVSMLLASSLFLLC